MTPPPLVVGMPVFERGWILEEWFDSLEAQDLPEGTKLLFAVTPGRDATERIIARRAPDAEVMLVEGLPSFGEDEKDDERRYAVLAHIRNMLLRRVCSIEPDAYLSWDSDIILPPGAVRALLDADVPAAGALVDMGGDLYPGHWSWMILSGRDAFRPANLGPTGIGLTSWGPLYEDGPPPPPPFQVGVIMGVKLLRPSAYMNGRYADHILGEDVGFALGLEGLGIERWLVPAARGDHRYRLDQRISSES